MIEAAVLGYGTVGSGVVEVIEKNQELVNKRAGDTIHVKYVLDLRDFPGEPIQDRIVHDVNVILEDPEVKIICETMGGNEPAYTFTKKALSLGKSVCTSNKELVANHGPELLRIARENNCSYLFEASVGGGIPIIRPINYSLTPEKIESITGILNGTTNYILTKMDKEGAEFEDVLKEAQEKGYAERNPEADVEGYDACRKIAILSSLMYGRNVCYEDVYTEGITKITSADFAFAKALGKTIKLLAMSKDVEGEYFAMVAPFMIAEGHPLYTVNDVFNGIFVHGNMLGDTMYYGRGAGKLPTASAVVSDVIDCARHLGKTVMCLWDEEELKLSDYRTAKHKYFIRMDANADAALPNLTRIFGKIKLVSIPECPGEVGIVTQEAISEAEYQEKAAAVQGIKNMIRIED